MTMPSHLFPEQDRPRAQRWLNALANAPQAERWRLVAATCPSDIERLVFYELGQNGKQDGKEVSISKRGIEKIDEVYKTCRATWEFWARKQKLNPDDLREHCMKRFLEAKPLEELQRTPQQPWPNWREPLTRLTAERFQVMTRIPVKWTEGNLTTFLRSQVFHAARDLQEARKREAERVTRWHRSKRIKGRQGGVQSEPDTSTSPISIDTCWRKGLADYETAVDKMPDERHEGRPVGSRARKRVADEIRAAIRQLRSQIDLLSDREPTVEAVEVSIRGKVQIEVPIGRTLAEFCKLGAKPSPRRCLGSYLDGWIEGLERLAETFEKEN